MLAFDVLRSIEKMNLEKRKCFQEADKKHEEVSKISKKKRTELMQAFGI